MLRSANSFTAVCKGPCELLVLDRAVLGNPDVESMIWLSLGRSVSDKLLVTSQAVGARKHASAADEPIEAPMEEHHMKQEIEALKVYTRAKTHNITKGLSVRSAIFLCSHLHTGHAEKEEIVHLRSSNQPVSVLALITGQMVVHCVVNNAPIPTFGSAICSLRAGDIYDPHNAKIEDPGADERKLDQSALTKEQSEYFIVDSAKYRVAVKKNILDSSLFARSVLQDIPLFDDLPSFTFDKLSKIAKFIRCRRDEVAFCSTDTSNGSVILLAEGDFKVTKKTTNHRTVTRLGPGMLFGMFNESAGRANMQAFTVFATIDSLMVQLPIKELVQQLPDATIKKLRKQLGDDMQHIAFKARADAELESSQAKSNQEPTMPTSSLGIPVRRQQIGIVGMPEYQATWNSGNMTNFFENIANGKVLPYPEDGSTKKLGRPPEEVLPSLRAGFVQRKLDEIQRKAHGEFMKARNASDIFSKEELQAREAKKAGVSKLRLLQDRVDQLRDNEKMRQQLAERVVGHKRDIIVARSAQDWTLINKKCPGDKAFEEKLKEEKRKKEDAIRDAMATQQENNEKRWKEKMEHTYHVMNRKELNDENNLQRLEEIRHRASKKRRIAVLLMTCALAVRMESWTSLCLKVRKMRNQLLLWSAAAITLQRKWREHVRCQFSVYRVFLSSDVILQR
jgi:CRP-like cAMP-binding protein